MTQEITFTTPPAQPAAAVVRPGAPEGGYPEAAAQARAAPAAPQKDLPEVAADAAKERMEHLAERLSDFVHGMRRDLKFRVDDDSHKVVISVIDPETSEVLRQIPSEEALRIARRLQEAGYGLIQEKA